MVFFGIKANHRFLSEGKARAKLETLPPVDEEKPGGLSFCWFFISKGDKTHKPST